MAATMSIIDSQSPKTYRPIYQASIYLTENKKDLLQLIKLRWPSNPRCQLYMKTDTANRFARPEVVVVNHCFTSLFGTNGILSDIVIR